MILMTVAGVLVRYAHSRMALLPAKGLQLSRTARILLALVIVMVVLQTARTVTGYFLAFDDSDYLAQSTTALYTNTINQYEPQTDRQVDILDQIEPHHKIALWGIIWATTTQLSGIHPSILCRTLLPVIVIPAAYIIMYLILKDMFGGEEEKPLTGLLFLQIAYELGSCSAGVRQWWLFMYSWYGKTVAAVLICPFILYLSLILENETNKKHQLQLWVLLALTALGRLYGSSLVLPYGPLPLRRTWPVLFCPKAEFAFLHQVRHLHHSLPGSLLHHSLTGGGRKNESFT